MEKRHLWVWRGFQDNGSKEWAYGDQRPEGTEDCTGSQGPQWTVVLEKEENFYNCTGHLLKAGNKKYNWKLRFLSVLMSVSCLDV